MLKGIDISHHNTDKKIMDFISQHYMPDFVIHKLTEGKTYVDPKVTERYDQLRDWVMNSKGLVGFYHYARPDNNTALEDARNYLGNLPMQNEYVLHILDWEGNALQHDFIWALEWCNIVHEETGRWPIIYASASVIKKYGTKYKYWWTAHYNPACEAGCSHDGGAQEVLTQYSNNPIDTDVFHGSYNDWTRIGYDDIELESDIVAEWTDEVYKYTVMRCKL